MLAQPNTKESGVKVRSSRPQKRHEQFRLTAEHSHRRAGHRSNFHPQPRSEPRPTTANATPDRLPSHHSLAPPSNKLQHSPGGLATGKRLAPGKNQAVLRTIAKNRRHEGSRVMSELRDGIGAKESRRLIPLSRICSTLFE